MSLLAEACEGHHSGLPLINSIKKAGFKVKRSAAGGDTLVEAPDGNQYLALLFWSTQTWYIYEYEKDRK